MKGRAALFLSCLIAISGFASALNLTTVCGTLPTAGEYYQLQNSVSATATCFNVTAANVTIDCSGVYNITYANTSAGNGVYSNSTNTTVKNCGINQTNTTIQSTYGIYYDNAANGTIYNTTIVTKSNGMALINASYANMTLVSMSITDPESAKGVYVDANTANSVFNSLNIQILHGGHYSSSIYVAGSNNVITNSYFYSKSAVGYGIMLFSSTNNNFTNVTVLGESGASGGGYAVQSQSGSGYFNNLTAKSTVSGVSVVYGVSSTFQVNNSNITTKTYSIAALSMSSSTFTSYNTLVNDGAGAVASLTGSTVNFTNCTFNKTNSTLDSSSTINTFWYANVHTTNSTGSDLANTNVNVSNVNGTSVANTTTNSTGWSVVTVQEFKQNSSGFYNYTPHWFNSTKNLYIENDTTANVSSSQTITIALTLNPITYPSITIQSPSNTTYAVSSVWFNVTTDIQDSWCGFSLDGANNVTMTNATGNLNWSYLNSTMTNSYHNVTFYCNSTNGGMSSASPIFFTVNAPVCLNLSTSNQINYILGNVSSAGTCMNITADNVTLDCSGYSINYSTSSTGYGVVSNSSNTTIKNCFIYRGSTQANSYDLYSTGEINATNSTFNKTRINAAGSGSINVFWYADVYVNKTGGSAFSGANVSIFDANNTLRFYQTTGNDEFPNYGASPYDWCNMSGNTLLYHMDESSGNVIDYSGNWLNATNHDLTYGVPGIASTTALNYTHGSDNHYYLSYSNASKVLGSTNASNWTISIWVNPNTISGTQGIFSAGYAATRGFGLYSNDGEHWIAWIGNGTKDIYWGNLAATPIANVWYNIVIVKSGVNFRSYENGQYSSATSTPMALNENSDSLYIGNTWNLIGAWGYNGKIDEFTVWNRTLSAGEIQSIYNIQVNGYNVSGFIQRQSLREFKFNATGYFYDTNYTVTANATGYDSITQPINLTADRTTDSNNPIVLTFTSSVADSVGVTYPVQYVIYQRDNATTGTAVISGWVSNYSKTLEASLNGSAYATLTTTTNCSSCSPAAFNATVNFPVSQGNLTVRMVSNTSANATVTDVGVGDVFLITGQSNADANFITLFNYTSYYGFTPTFYRGFSNPLPQGWFPANDTVGSFGGVGSAWPWTASELMRRNHVPIAFVTCAVGGSSSSLWQPDAGLNLYGMCKEYARNATFGTLKVKGAFYFQGEMDVMEDCNGSVSCYEGRMQVMAAGFKRDYGSTFNKTVVGQINEYTCSDWFDHEDGIRYAQQKSWADYSDNISQGPVTYDVALDDCLHFRQINETNAYMRRWALAANDAIYGSTDGHGPKIQRVYLDTSTNKTLVIVFDQNLTGIRYFDNSTATKAEDFKITNGTYVLNDSNVSSTTVSGNNLTVVLTVSTVQINAGYNLSYGLGASFVARAVPRGINDLPIDMIFNQSIDALPSTNTAPNVSLVSPNAAWDSGVNTHFIFTPTDDSGFSNCTTEIWYSNGTLLNATNWNTTNIMNNSPNQINYNFTATGNYSWNVLCYDNGTTPLSNQSTANYTVFVDATPPSITVDNPSNGSAYYSNAPLTINVSCTDAGSDVYSVFTNDSRFAAPDYLMPFNLTNSTTLTDGAYSVLVSCNDSLGNVNSSQIYFTESPVPTPTPVYYGGGGGSTPTPTVTITPAPTVLPNASSPVPSAVSTPTPSPSPSTLPSVQPSVSGLNAAKEKDIRTAISVLRELIRVAKSQGKDVQEAERLLNLAQQAFERGDYAAASEFARQSDAALKKASVVKGGLNAAGFDWSGLAIAGVAVIVLLGAAWFYAHRRNK